MILIIKFSIIIIILSGLGFLLYYYIYNNKPSGGGGGGSDINKCGNSICNKKIGESCQSDNITCCKNELWGKDTKGYDICCDKPLCGNICCDKTQICGKDKNGNPICCDSELCGDICCESNKPCKTDGDNKICCGDSYWGKDKDGNMKCCDKLLCGDICCDTGEECDPDLKKCIACKTITCEGDCCEQGKTCYKGDTKKICCDKEPCGDNCCNKTQTCMPDKTCCDIPCKNNTKCCKPGYTCINNDICCQSDVKCVDEIGNPICYNIDQCGKDKNGNCICCKIGEKYDPVSFKCKTYCGNEELCDIDTQYCVKENDKFVGCANKNCVWSSYTYDPPTIIDNGKNIDVCSSNNKYYITNNPTDINGNIIPLSSLKRTSYVTQDKSILYDCTLGNCKDKINEVNMQFINYDNIDTLKKCSATFDCNKLESNKNICPLTHTESCCKDNTGKFTGQICPSNRICYKGDCVCNQGDDPTTDNCILYDCGKNGLADFSSGNFVCHCDKDFTGIKCQYGKNTTCQTHGDPNYDGSCKCYTGFTGSNCQYSRANCSNSGNPNSDGLCTCDSGFLGKNCEYSRNKTCSGHGIVDSNGNCYCDPSFSTANCSISKPIDWMISTTDGNYPSILNSGSRTITVKNPLPSSLQTGILYYGITNTGDIQVGEFENGDDNEILPGFETDQIYKLDKTTGKYIRPGYGIPQNAPYMYAINS